MGIVGMCIYTLWHCPDYYTNLCKKIIIKLTYYFYGSAEYLLQYIFIHCGALLNFKYFVTVAQSLLSSSTHLCGSFNTGRKFWPKDLKTQKSVRKKGDPVRTLKRGQHMVRQTKDGKMIATVWRDSKHVFNLSTCFNPVPSNQDTVLRKAINSEGRWEKTEYPCPPAIVGFNKYMGGVDRHDHPRSSYTVQRPSVRWWTYFMWFAVDIALVNSYIMYKSVKPKAKHQKFQIRVAEQLIGGYCSRKRKPKESHIVGTVDREFAESHEMISMPARTRACRFCSIKKVKTTGGVRTPTSSFACKQCHVTLHRECFLPYHDVTSRTGMVEDKCTQTSDVQTALSETTPVKRPGKRCHDRSASEQTQVRKSPSKKTPKKAPSKSPRRSTKKK